MLYSFAGGNDGSQPQAALTQGVDGNFYGTSLGGGIHGKGTLFKITPSGLEAVLYSFTGGSSHSDGSVNKSYHAMVDIARAALLSAGVREEELPAN